ncbi:protein SICKLE [Benincasa hispida]|uniref:protein SICKLE n=1 Tax=Benincasa hispida TaxID=102211 RepID=UPI001900132E|nr:protein SICKLE [Benincasa hispida]
MEESEKRRERLRAMRMEAAQADVANYVETSLPSHLSNPLVESSGTMIGQLAPCTAPRFDYYTNPMAAFSTSKKREKIENQPVSDNYVPYHHNTSSATYLPPNVSGLRNPEMSPSSTHQFHQYSPDQRTFYARGVSGSGGHGSPAMPRPFPMDQGAHMWHGPRRPLVNQFPSHPPRMSSPSHVSGQIGNSYTNPTQDRVNTHSSSPSPGYQGSFSPGRGGHGHRGNMTPSPRFGSGRGAGSHGRHSLSDKSSGPEQFYNASMLEDPWKVLQPGIWTTIPSLNPSDSWISKFGTKKARVSNSSSGRSSCQPSLAEYLAASFKEAVEDAPNE